MRKLYTPLLTTFLCLLAAAGSAQDGNRFLDARFGVEGPTQAIYGRNYSLLGPAGTPDTIPLVMDIYQPAGDETDTERPVVCIFPTGNFLPKYFNGGAYGDRTDSVNVELARRFARRGFVAIVASYRLGWRPTATEQFIRTGSLLRAVYRASQDAHNLVRYLRFTVDQQDNPLNIDTDRIVMFGVGSGGYVVAAHNFLDNVDQIAQNEQFYDPEFNLLVDSTVISTPDGLFPASEHIVNYPGYSSDVALTVNLGGALGDTLWIDGEDNEAPTISIHSATDPFAPFYRGTVVVPTDPPMRVVDVQGSNLMVQIANELGINDVLAPANEVATLPAMFGPLARIVNARIAAFSQVQFQSPIPTNTRDVFQLGRPNLLTVLRTAPPQVGLSGATTGVWNWFNEARLRAEVAAINAAVPTANLSADRIVAGEDQTNPNRSNPARAKANIDTIMAFVLPRAFFALELGDVLAGTEDLLDAGAVGLSVAPNPAADHFTVRTAAGFPIREVSLFDLNGRLVRQRTAVDQTSLRFDRGELPNGTYFVRIRVDEGVVAQQLFLH